MELRATANGTSVSKTFVAAVLVLVAMGLGATGGYLAKGLGASGTPAAAVQQTQVQYEPNRFQKDDPYTSDTTPIRAISGGGDLVR